MKTNRSRAYVAVVLLTMSGAILALLVLRRFPQGGAVGGSEYAESAPTHQSAGSPNVASPDPLDDLELFGASFELTHGEVEKVSDRVRERFRLWKEEKGGAARVVSVEGHVLRMQIPALSLSPAQLRGEVEREVAKEVGQDRARRICGSTSGWATLVRWSSIDLLPLDQDIVFTRIQAEGRLDQCEYALFNAILDQHDTTAGAMPRVQPELQFIEGYDYQWLGNSDLFSWTAMAKAPQGYFRSEPILGLASAPKPMVIVDHEFDTGKVTIRNLREPGSVEQINLGNDRATGRSRP